MPPAVVHVHQVVAQGRGLQYKACRTLVGGDLHAVARFQAQPLGRGLAHLRRRVRRLQAEGRVVEVHRRVVGLLARAGDHRQVRAARALGVLHEPRRAQGRRRRGRFGQARPAERRQELARQLYLARGGGEALRLAVGARQLVLGVRRRLPVDAQLAERVPVHARARELRRERVGQRLLRPRVNLAQAQAKAAEHVVVAPSLVVRLHGGGAAVAHVRHAAVHLQHGALDGTGRRQHVVGDHGRGRHIVVQHHQQVQAHERIEHAVRVGIGEQRVRGVHDERAHRVRLALLHGAQHEVRQRGGQVALRQRAAQLLGELAGAVVAFVALQRREGRVQAARAPLGLQRVGHLQLHLRHEVRSLGQHARTGLVHVSRHGAQTADGAVRGRHVRAHLVNPAARHERRGARPPEQARRPHDVVLRQAAHRGHMRGRVGPHVRGQLVEPVAPGIHERAVRQALLDDHVQKSQRQRAVGARPHGQPEVRHGRRLRAPRVDDHERRIRACERQDGPPERRVVGLRRVRAPDEQALRHPRHDVGLHGPTERERIHPDARVPANLPDAHVVGAAEQVHEAVQRPERRMRAADGARKRLRAVFVGKRLQARRDIVERFVPAHALPLVAAALPDAAKRMVHAVGAVQRVQVHAPAAAARQDALVVRVARRVGHEVRHAPVLHGGQKRAAVAAVVAVRGFDLGRHRASSRSSPASEASPLNGRASPPSAAGSSNRKRSFM